MTIVKSHKRKLKTGKIIGIRRHFRKNKKLTQKIQPKNKTGYSEDQIYEMLYENSLVGSEISDNILVEEGKDLENWYMLFKLGNSYIVAKNCQSVHGWHLLEFYDNKKKAKERFDFLVESDYENQFVLEMREYE